MEFDLDYDEVFYDGEPRLIGEADRRNVKTILRSGLDDFSVKEIGLNNLVLERLWEELLLLNADQMVDFFHS